MVPVELGPKRLRNQPAASDRNARDLRADCRLTLFPARKIYRSGIRAQRHELRKGELRAVRQRAVASKVSRTIAGQPEDERAEHVHAMLAKCLQAVRSGFAGQVEILVDVFQPLRGNGFDSDQRALDARGFHGIQESRIFGRLHRDLREEDHVVWKLRQARHQLKPLRSERFQLVQSSSCYSVRRQAQDRSA